MFDLDNKKILILGFGKDGKSTYNYIKTHSNAEITIMDQNYENIEGAIDVDYNTLDEYDLIFKTPGISLKDVDISPFKNKLTSQLDFLYKNKNAFTIGVTGSKGKSTTASLIYEVLKNNNKKVLLLGNIGSPILDYFDEIDDDTILVIEMSSHQLEYLYSSPNIAVITNFYEEHLDHYKSLNDYYLAKLNIVKYQNYEDSCIYFKDNLDLLDYINKTDIRSKKYEVSKKDNNTYTRFYDNYILVDQKEWFNVNEDIYLKGDHNLVDIALTLTVANILNLDIDLSNEAIKNFKGLAHRMEFVKEAGNVKYYNDSIATIPASTINAIEALKEVNTLIIGGKDRGINYDDFVAYLKKCNVQNIVCLPDTGHDIYNKLQGYKNIFKVSDVKEAVEVASKITKDGICLLSPAASSYGFYKNFEERGNEFKKFVERLD